MLLPILAVATGAFQGVGPALAAPPLPRPVTNNAVTWTQTSRGPTVFSLLGLDSTKRWDGVVRWVFRWSVGDDAWTERAPVPGPGRLASTAEAVRGRLYLFGGYTVAADGSERSLPNVDIYDPSTDTWESGAPIPVPVDDAVSGVWRDSLVYLVSGWHDRDNVSDVQIYDPSRDEWQAGTPIPGAPVFGHAGALAGNTIVYVDGVRVDRDPRRFRLERSAWAGVIDPAQPARITWRRLPDHPGAPRYRAGAAVVDTRIVFAGGTANPYNYDGIGYDGMPSEPHAGVFAFDVAGEDWSELPSLSEAVMDLRALAVIDRRVVIVGGMGPGRRVRDEVLVHFVPPRP